MEGRNMYESVLAVLLLWLLLYYFFWTTPWVMAGIIIFLVVVLLSPVIARFVALSWEYLTKAIGFVMNRILMTLVFLLILTPIATLYRLTKKKTTAQSSDSAFFDRNHRYTAKDLETPW